MEPGTLPPAAPAPAPPVSSGCVTHTKHIALSAIIGVIAGAGILLAVIRFSGRRIVKRTVEPAT